MIIKNSFDVPLPPAEAWAVLMDIGRIVPCVPGAELVELVDERTFKGKVAVKLGPVALVFAGTAVFDDRDDTAHTARIKAQGSDAKGRGGANATVNFTLNPSDAGSRVDVVTYVALSGSVAQYGRGTGIIQGVATQLVDQFAKCLRAMLSTSAALPAGAHAPASPPAAGADSSATAAASPAPPAAPAKPISGFSLMLQVVWNALAGLFRGKHDRP